MITINAAQLDAFSTVALANKNQWQKERLVARFPHLPSPSLDQLVSDGRVIAARYGVEREEDIATLLDCMVMFGPRFDEDGWAAGILGLSQLHAPDRISLLRRALTESGVPM